MKIIKHTWRWLLALLLIMSFHKSNAQFISKNDRIIMGIEVFAGYVQGWREEGLYHPAKFHEHFPSLNPTFWDSRVSWKKKGLFNMSWDANHIEKAVVTMSHLVAISFKFGEKPNFLKILKSVGLNYAAYQAGFLLSYNVTHGNKL